MWILSEIGFAHFEGLRDTRGIAIELTQDGNGLCTLLAASGSDCVPCPNATGDEAYCVFLAGDIEEVLMVPNLTLEDMKNGNGKKGKGKTRVNKVKEETVLSEMTKE